MSRRVFQSIELLAVKLDYEGESMEVGKLAWSKEERCAYFEYDQKFIDRKLPISPFKLVAGGGVNAAPNQPFGDCTASSTTASLTVGAGCCSIADCRRCSTTTGY